MKADKEIIKKYAREIGMDLIGFAKAETEAPVQRAYKNFIAENRHGDMSYLEDAETRFSPEAILPTAKSVIVIALNYYRPQPPLPAGHGRVARYAYGRDYHKVIKSYLKKLEKFILETYPLSQTRACVDSAPLPEKNYAVKAGLGFIGKNTTLITKEFGSYVLIGELLTDLEFDYNEPVKGTCGTCTRCMEACPSKALIEPYKMDARRCVSYLTIESKKEIPAELKSAVGCRIFGCDICQEVCPYNKSFARTTTQKDFIRGIAGDSIALDEIMALKNDKQYVARFAGSPLMRAKRAGLQRNARTAQSNLSR